MTQHTALHAEHLAAGAKLVDFAGWDMPLHYGSQIEEHHAVRRVAGMFDVSHMLVIDLHGPTTRAFLAGLLANDPGKLSVPGKALYSCLLREDGGVLDDLIAYYLAEDHFRLVVNAGTALKDLAWIERHAGPAGVRVVPRRDLAMIALQGPQARAALWRALPGSQAASEPLKAFSAAAWDDLLIARTGYTGEDGFELMLPAGRAAGLWQTLHGAGVQPCGLGARDTLRLEAGMNLYGQDMDETVTPFDCGLGWTVALEGTREFIGRGALAAHPRPWRFVGLLLEDRGVLRAHQLLRSAHGDGETTSGGFAPTLQRSIALARVPAALADGERVTVEVRGKPLAARVVRPPFVRHGAVRVEL